MGLSILEKKEKRTDTFSSGKGVRDYTKVYYFGEDRKTVKQLVSPDGANSVPLTYFTLNDGGKEYYYRGFYLLKNARYPVIAETYTRLFDFPGVTSTVFIHPLLSESVKRVNRRIDMLNAELYSVKEDPNRQRVLAGKLSDAEELAKTLDTGDQTLFEVRFLFLLKRESLEALESDTKSFCKKAEEANMELSGCYGAHLEAFKASFPVNSLYPVRYKKNWPGFIDSAVHIFDQASLSTIYNHTTSEMFHKEGPIIGHIMESYMPFSLDPFRRNAFSYGVVVSGKTGYGKSATIKQVYTRLIDFGYQVASIDFKNNGRRGEYAAPAEAVGGVNYSIGVEGGDKINLFELSEETELDEITKREIRVLRVNDKIVELANILLSIALHSAMGDSVTSGYDPSEVARMQDIIVRVVQTLYHDRGIAEGRPDSLYEMVSVQGKIGMSRKKKTLPQMKDFYMALIRAQAKNTDEYKKNAFAFLIDRFYHRVRELYFCPTCLEEFSKEEYERLPRLSDGRRYHECAGRQVPVATVKGSQAYFDTQSTVFLDDPSCPWYNFDISGAPENEKPVLVLVAKSYIDEHFIKRNSVDPTKARNLLFLTDEFHKVIEQVPLAISSYSYTYRTARAHHVSSWLCTQSIADFDKTDTARDILKQTELMLLLHHQPEDRESIAKNTLLTDSQVDGILNLGGTDQDLINLDIRYGEVCVIDSATKQVAFVQVDYLRQSEEYIVETDTERRKALAER